MKKLGLSLSYLWKRSLWITVPGALLFFVWLFAVVDRYSQIGIRHDGVGGQALFLKPVMEYEWDLLVQKARLSLPTVGRSEGLRRVDLMIVPAAEERLNERLPGSGRTYQKARMGYPDGSSHKVSVRYRGDHMQHWAFAKRSWRIKTKKKNLWNGSRKFNLVVPETKAILETHLACWLGKEMDLLAPSSDIVELSINGENRGVYTLLEQLDELFLRSNGRMPGDLFVGELVERDALPGFTSNLFDLPGLWSKAAINNHYPDEHRASLQGLAEMLDWESGPRLAKALGEVLDMPAFGRLAAYKLLTQSAHMDSYHNWRFYYDPWRNQFEPVVWDPSCWNSAWGPNANFEAFQWPTFSEFDRVLVMDHHYRWATHVALVEYFDKGLDARLIEKLNHYRDGLHTAAKRDPALSFSIFPLQPGVVQEQVQRLFDRMQTYHGLFRSNHVVEPAQVYFDEPQALGPGEWEMRVTVDGWKPVAGLMLDFAMELPVDARFAWGVLGDPLGRQRPVAGEWEGAQARLDQPLLPGVRVEPINRNRTFTHQVQSRPLTYVLQIQLPGRKQLELKQLRAFDLGGAFTVVSRRPETIEQGSVGDEFAPLFQKATPETTVWSGRKTLSGLTEIRGPLRLEAGTVLSMEGDASVVVHGKVTALGTADSPIRIQPANPEQAPWGTFAIRTKQAGGSLLQHVHMAGGSGLKDGYREFSAMLSVHDLRGLRLDNCSFDQSYVVDDMVHLVYVTDFEIKSCSFSNALSDALDLDACEGLIVDCHFEKSGNDAIDLMMSQVKVEQTQIHRSGDKGISVGESSELSCKGGHIARCAIGVQVKDRSMVRIEGTTFDGNQLALNASKKNWQYGSGGLGLALNCTFQGAGQAASADKHSSLHLHACRLPWQWEGEKHVHVASSVGAELPLTVRARFQNSASLGGL